MALINTPAADFGIALPHFSLPTVQGQPFDSKNLPSQCPVVIMFICNHCPYVKAIEDRLVRLGHDLQNAMVPVIAICSNDPTDYPDDSVEALAARAKQKQYPFVYLHDNDQAVAKLFGAVCTPDFFVYDKNHLLAYRGRLDDNWRDPSQVARRELFDAVIHLVESKPILGEQHSSMGCSIKWKK